MSATKDFLTSINDFLGGLKRQKDVDKNTIDAEIDRLLAGVSSDQLRSIDFGVKNSLHTLKHLPSFVYGLKKLYEESVRHIGESIGISETKILPWRDQNEANMAVKEFLQKWIPENSAAQLRDFLDNKIPALDYPADLLGVCFDRGAVFITDPLLPATIFLMEHAPEIVEKTTNVMNEKEAAAAMEEEAGPEAGDKRGGEGSDWKNRLRKRANTNAKAGAGAGPAT